MCADSVRELLRCEDVDQVAEASSFALQSANVRLVIHARAVFLLVRFALAQQIQQLIPRNAISLKLLDRCTLPLRRRFQRKPPPLQLHVLTRATATFGPLAPVGAFARGGETLTAFTTTFGFGADAVLFMCVSRGQGAGSSGKIGRGAIVPSPACASRLLTATASALYCSPLMASC